MKELFQISLFFLVFASSISAQEIKEKAEELLRQSFGKSITLSMNKYIPDNSVKLNIERVARQRFNSDFVYLYTVKDGNDVKGYALIDNVPGKAMPITFMVIFDPKGSILSSHILKYREQYGGAVSNSSWNKQFTGKTGESGFEVGKDIDGISGATISVNSVTKGIQKLSLLIDKIRREKN